MQKDADDTNPWDEYAAGWDDDEAARAYASAAFASLVQVMGPQHQLTGARVLDFGCGTGLLTEQLIDAGANVHGVDTSQAMIDVLAAKQRLQASTRLTTATTLPPLGQAFDLIVCSSVCAFVDDYPATAADLAQRLRPGGLFVQWDWEREPNDDDGLSRAEISTALQAAGLEETHVGIGFELEFGDACMKPLIGHGRKPVAP